MVIYEKKDYINNFTMKATLYIKFIHMATL